MGTIRVRFIVVALVVSFFAVGMSAFLNYFKYKSTISGIVRSRVLVIGRNIENSVQASLSVGMQFMEIGTMNALLARERASDRLVRGIDVFDHTGQIIYSTDRGRVGDKVPTDWIDAAARSKTTEWSQEGSDEYIAGISLKNNFDLTVGYLALRYSREEVDTNFSGMINAFKYGAPPHGGSAPGIDRIVMLLADEPNIREVILFPMNQKAEDLMMNAPASVMAKQLKELHIKVVPDS